MCFQQIVDIQKETGNKKDSLLFVYWYLTVIIDSRLFPHSPVQTRCITTHPQNLSIFIHFISIKPYHNSENIFEAVITKLFCRTIPVVHFSQKSEPRHFSESDHVFHISTYIQDVSSLFVWCKWNDGVRGLHKYFIITDP